MKTSSGSEEVRSGGGIVLVNMPLFEIADLNPEESLF